MNNESTAIPSDRRGKIQAFLTFFNQLTPRNEAILVIIIVAVALGLRLGYLSVSHAWDKAPNYDGIEYDILAKSLSRGDGYELQPGVPYGFRPPGFPAYMSLLYAIFGPSTAVVRLFNVLLSALTCVPIYLLAKALWGKLAALIAAVGIGFHPLLIYFNGLIYPESLMLFLISVALLFGYYAMTSGSLKWVFLVGLVSAALVYLRPNLIIFSIGHLVWIWLGFKNIKRRVLAGSILIGVQILLILPWGLRNNSVFDKFVWMSTNGGTTLWAGNNPLADGGWIEPSPSTWLDPGPPADLRGWPGLTETESEARFQDKAMAWIRAHPGTFLTLIPRKLYRAWGLNFGNESRDIAMPKVVGLAYGVFVLISLAGLVFSIPQWRYLIPAYMLIIASTFTTVLYYGSTRQTAILAPLTVSLAAYSACWMLSFATSRLGALKVS
jgi:4-amino-4-deoxy-L-arabinose transferase-like glycosyltransferase